MPTLTTCILGVRGSDREVANFKLDMSDGDHPFSIEKLARRVATVRKGPRRTVRDIMERWFGCPWIEYATKGTAILLRPSQRMSPSAFGPLVDAVRENDGPGISGGQAYMFDPDGVEMAANLRFAAHHPELVSFPDRVEWSPVELVDREWDAVRFYTPAGNPMLRNLTDLFPDLDIFLISATGDLPENRPVFTAEFAVDNKREGMPFGLTIRTHSGKVTSELERGSLTDGDWGDIAELLWSPQHQIY